MKKKLASKSAFFNPRVLTVFALCVIGGLLALGVAFSASLAPHAASPKEAANPAIPVTSSALAPAFDQGPVQSQQKTEPNVLFAVLYDQNNNTGGASTVSQNFEASQDAADSQAADDFAVPGGETWTIQQVVVTGVYFNGAPPPGGPAVSFNVFFYAAVATLPGPVVTGGTQLNATYTNAAGVFTITLPTAVVLPTGKYWVSVQANMDFGAPTAGEWGWTDRSVTNGVSATWQNPGGGFAAGCLTWGRRGATCGIDAPNPDQMFQLLGTSGPGAGTPSPTPTATATIAVSPTATPTPGCENYVVTNTALTFVPGTTDIGNHTDDGVTVIALPFPVKFYGNTYTAAAAGSNGFLNLSGTFVNTFYTGCLPNAGFTYTIFPFEVDQITSQVGGGIFTLTTGSTPTRKFYIEWRACQYATATTCLANSSTNYEIVFEETPAVPNSFSIAYGTFGSADATVGAIGVQGRSGFLTQSQCNLGRPVASSQLYSPCIVGTPTPTPTPTVSATPTPTPCSGVITQSLSQTILAGNSVSCNNGTTHDDNSYWRAFTLAPFTGGSQFIVNSASFGVESANLTQPVTVRLYTQNVGTFPTGYPGNLTQIGTTTINVTAAQSGTVVTAPMFAVVPAATSQLVMEVFTPNGSGGGFLLYIGSNDATQTGPSYLSAAACGITTPTDTATIGFPDMHLVFNVTGACSSGTPSPTPTATATVPVTPTPTPTPTPTVTPTPGACFWSLAAPAPSPLLDSGVASVGTNLYSFGGVIGGAISAASSKFDGTTWTAIAPLPAALEAASAVSDGTNIYILGGALTGTGVPQTTLYRYNVGADNYTTLNPFTTGTWNQAAVFLGGKIYKFAGTAAAGSTNALEIYDISGGGWTTGANYPVAISFVSAWAQGGFIYAAGGIDSATSTSSVKTYRYDPVGNTWNDLIMTDLPASRWGAATGFYTCCTTTGGLLAGGYVGGGATTNISTSTIYYDVGSNSWINLNPMTGEGARMGGAAVGCNFYAVGGRSAASPLFAGTVQNQKFFCPCAPSPTPTVSISGVVTYCTNPALPPVPNVTMSLTGPTPAPTSTLTNGSGAYTLTGLFTGNNYTLTPTKAGLPTGSTGISLTDVLAINKHFLIIGTPLSGCPLLAADTTGDGNVTLSDVLATNSFFLARSTGLGLAGQYRFTPASQSYTPISGNQTTNFGAVIRGDVVTSFVPAPRPGGGGGDEMSSSEVPAMAASVVLPEVGLDQSTAAVTSSAIDAKSNLVGFSGDLTFDERVVTFASEPVQKAGITAGNWNVSGNVLPGNGPIRTLRISAFSNDFSPLSGSGTLFELKMTRVSKTQDAKLAWAPAPNQLIFVDADLTSHAPNAR